MIHEELITTVPMDGNRPMDGNWSHSHLASARWPLRDVNWKPFKTVSLLIAHAESPG